MTRGQRYWAHNSDKTTTITRWLYWFCLGLSHVTGTWEHMNQWSRQKFIHMFGGQKEDSTEQSLHRKFLCVFIYIHHFGNWMWLSKQMNILLQWNNSRKIELDWTHMSYFLDIFLVTMSYMTGNNLASPVLWKETIEPGETLRSIRTPDISDLVHNNQHLN